MELVIDVGNSETVLGIVEPGDLVITMGAGDIWRQCKAFFEQLVERNAEVAS